LASCLHSSNDDQFDQAAPGRKLINLFFAEAVPAALARIKLGHYQIAGELNQRGILVAAERATFWEDTLCTGEWLPLA
jgi:hypothetical protein